MILKDLVWNHYSEVDLNGEPVQSSNGPGWGEHMEWAKLPNGYLVAAVGKDGTRALTFVPAVTGDCVTPRELAVLRESFGLMNSMISSGERHSDESREIVECARAILSAQDV